MTLKELRDYLNSLDDFFDEFEVRFIGPGLIMYTVTEVQELDELGYIQIDGVETID